MEFELLAEAPLLALDVLGAGDGLVKPDLESGMDWPLRQASNSGLSDVLLSVLDFDDRNCSDDAVVRTSSKRSYAESEDSPPSDGLYDDGPSLFSSYSDLTDLASSPKRTRSSSFEEILNDLPSVVMAEHTMGESAASSDIGGARTALSASDTIFVFPPSNPGNATTPTSSPTKPLPAAAYKPGKRKAKTIQSTNKPNFLKPLTAHERRLLHEAGTGSVIIRMDKSCGLN